jgi:hypothetical protein
MPFIVDIVEHGGAGSRLSWPVFLSSRSPARPILLIGALLLVCFAATPCLDCRAVAGGRKIDCEGMPIISICLCAFARGARSFACHMAKPKF